ncbi:DUF1405 domain-containing protein [Halorarius halobius]|uniref:DUF1405 domain-containing protein n=1 Tax=Halorarius halobius TaxID=2962671 RepID=UPI0020CEF377|nr:DUF1405 domain-containing protein [Halorarius halobius]
MSTRVGDRLNALASRYAPGGDEDVPDAADLPWYVAPLPDWLEEFGLRLAWVVVLVNLAGTAFGFYYYGFQFSITDPVMWPFVPDSPLATLFIAGSLALWKLDRHSEVVAALAFFGCIKLGAWTPFVLLVVEGQGDTGWAMYQFLVWSHLAMVVQAFLLQRYADFRVGAVAVALAWYAANDVVDYFVPVVGEPHHTVLEAELVNGAFDHTLAAHDTAAAGAVVLTMACTFLALATRAWKLKRAA